MSILSACLIVFGSSFHHIGATTLYDRAANAFLFKFGTLRCRNIFSDRSPVLSGVGNSTIALMYSGDRPEGFCKAESEL